MEGQIWWQSPAGIIFLVVLAVLGGGIFFLRLASNEATRQASIELARSVASCPQRVGQILVWPSGGVIGINLMSADESLVRCHLVFDDKHPDFPDLVEITSFYFLEFRFQETPITGLNPKNATSYLRLKR